MRWRAAVKQEINSGVCSKKHSAPGKKPWQPVTRIQAPWKSNVEGKKRRKCSKLVALQREINPGGDEGAVPEEEEFCSGSL
jgi:hypothetical protein